MANNIIVIIGGETFDQSIKSFFDNYNLNIIHYDARSSSSLKKQTVPKNTIGVIITVDRSHMVFGNSNEITRNLQTQNIPFVFSSGNFASLNSSKILVNKILKKYPELIIQKEYTSVKEKQLEFYKKEWVESDLFFLNILEKWLEILSQWDKTFNTWEKTLDSWKLNIVEWKSLQTNKDITKKLRNNLNYLKLWKEELHDQGIELDRQLKIILTWKNNIEDSCNELLSIHEELEDNIKNIKDLNDKVQKNTFKTWKTTFSNWQENIYLWENDYGEWENIIPLFIEKMNLWDKEIKLWNRNRLRNDISY